MCQCFYICGVMKRVDWYWLRHEFEYWSTQLAVVLANQDPACCWDFRKQCRRGDYWTLLWKRVSCSEHVHEALLIKTRMWVVNLIRNREHPSILLQENSQVPQEEICSCPLKLLSNLSRKSTADQIVIGQVEWTSSRVCSEEHGGASYLP